jgi:hypothetical protein
MSEAIPLLPQYAFMACYSVKTQTTLHFTFTFILSRNEAFSSLEGASGKGNVEECDWRW